MSAMKISAENIIKQQRAEIVRLKASDLRLREALVEAGKHINILRDEWSETDRSLDPLPDYIASALATL